MDRIWKVPTDERGDAKNVLSAGGITPKAAAAWLKSEPRVTASYARDTAAHGKFWKTGTDLLAKLPRKPKRNAAEQRAADAIFLKSRASREAYLARHADAIYRKLTKNLSNFVRLEQLVYDAGKLVPGLTPTRKQVEAEAQFMQSQKDGVEVDQGLFLSHVLADAADGMHLCETMLRPKPEALERAAEFARNGVIDFGPARVERQGKAAVVTIQNPRYLNAEDNTTLADTETATDIAIIDADSQICVLRGGVVQHPKYAGRNVFCSGINLTHIYNGKIPYIWYIVRDMAPVNKMMRGLATGVTSPDEIHGGTREKPWMAGLDVFAIGGGCQLLLAMDYVIAGSDAYMTLPARKEGIIPGAANLRFSRFVGPRVSRQAIMMGKRLDCDTAEGRLVCDVVVPPGDVNSTIAQVVQDYTDSGVVSAAGNRRALRVGEEPLDMFRRYMAVYCREQAYCHFSPALIANLEKHWNAASRKM